MPALSTTRPMSKITRLAISRKLVNQKNQKKCSSEFHIFTPFYKFLTQNSKYKWPKIVVQLFGHLENQHLTPQQMAQR